MTRIASSALPAVLLVAGRISGTSPIPPASTTPAGGTSAPAATSAAPGPACTADYTVGLG